jgi:hypothetical protein
MENIFQKSSEKRTTVPEKLKFTWKLNIILRNQVCKNHGPRESGDAIIGETVLHVFILELLLWLFHLSVSTKPYSVMFMTMQSQTMQVLHKRQWRFLFRIVGIVIVIYLHLALFFSFKVTPCSVDIADTGSTRKTMTIPPHVQTPTKGVGGITIATRPIWTECTFLEITNHMQMASTGTLGMGITIHLNQRRWKLGGFEKKNISIFR